MGLEQRHDGSNYGSLKRALKGLDAFRTVGQADNLVFETMITAKGISKNIKGMRKITAPGLDSLSLRDLNKIDP